MKHYTEACMAMTLGYTSFLSLSLKRKVVITMDLKRYSIQIIDQFAKRNQPPRFNPIQFNSIHPFLSNQIKSDPAQS